MLPLTKCSKIIDLILEQGFKTSNPELLALLDEYQERGEVDTKPKQSLMRRLNKACSLFDGIESEVKETLFLSRQSHRRDSMIIAGMAKQYVERNTELAYAMHEAITLMYDELVTVDWSSYQHCHDELFGGSPDV